LPQQIQIDAAIGIAGKDKLPCIPTLGNVMRYPNRDHPGQTRYASYLNDGSNFFGDSAQPATNPAKLLVRRNKAPVRTTLPSCRS
jgi:hypothetical protein